MKKIIFIVAILISSQVFSQLKQYDIQFMPAVQTNTNDDISEYFKNNLFNKVNQEITKTGCGAVDVSRFVVLINPSVLEKNTNGQLILYKFDVLFSIVDLLTKKSYNSFSIEIGGVGKTPGQAAIDAIKRFDVKQSKLSENIKLAADEIINYYKKNCNTIIAKTKTLSNTGRFEEAIANLYYIPDINELPCANDINATTEKVYQQSISSRCQNALTEAKKEWSLKMNDEGAQAVSTILSGVSLSDECKATFNILINEIKAKITKDQFDALSFRNKVYEDGISLEKQRMSNMKEIAIEYYKSLIPPTYNYNHYDITNNTKKTNN